MFVTMHVLRVICCAALLSTAPYAVPVDATLLLPTELISNVSASTTAIFGGHNFNPRNVFDRDSRTIPNACNCCWSSENEMSPWLQVDMKTALNINRIEIKGRSDFTFEDRLLTGIQVISNGIPIAQSRLIVGTYNTTVTVQGAIDGVTSLKFQRNHYGVLRHWFLSICELEIYIGKCAWNNHYCWPGTCADDLTKNCSCEPGFRRVSRGDLETSCQLVPNNAPIIDTCDTTFEDAQGHQKAALHTSTSGACQYLTDVYGNFQPVLLLFDLLAEFSVDTRCIYRPYFIHDSGFGITDTTAYIIKQPVTGSRSILQTERLQVDNSSSLGAISISAQTQNLPLTYHLLDGQRLCVKYESLGGGYLHTVDPRQWPHIVSNPVPYQKTNTTKEICYRYDSTPPKHCLEDGASATEPLHIKDRITRSDIVHLEFLGWKDPIPTGGNPSHASGIDSYQISVSEVLPSGGNLTVNNESVYSVMLNENETSTTLNLSADEPKLYCIRITVKDIAGNVHQARRFVLYDNTSTLISMPDKPFKVISASPLTHYTWQTNYSDICISWKDHFYNDFYINNTLLNPIEADQYGSISGVYEQTTPPLSVSGTPNLHGIVNFFFSSKLNNGQFSTPTPVPIFQNQSLCQHFNVRDGQTYTLNIAVVDIVSNSYSEQRIVHIDGSAPIVFNFWLVKNGHRVLTVNTLQQLSDLTVRFEAFDYHSGVRNISWMFGDTSGTGTTQRGTVPVLTTKAGCASQVNPCYCPSVGLCEVYEYSVPLRSLVNLNAHDRNYFFMVNVTNHAMLTDSARMDIIVDDKMPAVIGR